MGSSPAVLLVVWSPNDIINDAFYPHSTVIDGWQVDTLHISAAQDVVHDASDVLTERVRNRVRAWHSLWRKPKMFFMKYSAAYNMLMRALYPGRFGRWLAHDVFDDPDRRSIYSLQRHYSVSPVLSYLHDDLAQKNREALLEIKAYADSINARLLIALLSEQPGRNIEVRDFLREHSIKYVDLGILGYNFSDKHLAWRIDLHANEQGNEVIADALYRFVQPELRGDASEVESFTNGK